jgi:hypothetical protein
MEKLVARRVGGGGKTLPTGAGGNFFCFPSSDS